MLCWQWPLQVRQPFFSLSQCQNSKHCNNFHVSERTHFLRRSFWFGVLGVVATLATFCRSGSTSQTCSEQVVESRWVQPRFSAVTLQQLTMGGKEEKSLLPTSSPVNAKVKQRQFPLKRAFCWLQVLTIAFIVCWLTLLTLKSWSSDDTKTLLLPENVIRQLITNQEVKLVKF